MYEKLAGNWRVLGNCSSWEGFPLGGTWFSVFPSRALPSLLSLLPLCIWWKIWGCLHFCTALLLGPSTLTEPLPGRLMAVQAVALFQGSFRKSWCALHLLSLIHLFLFVVRHPNWGFPGGTEPICQCRRLKRRGFDP